MNEDEILAEILLNALEDLNEALIDHNKFLKQSEEELDRAQRAYNFNLEFRNELVQKIEFLERKLNG